MSRYDEPPERLTWYHLPYLLAAEAGKLAYDTKRYRIHGVPNNAADAHLRGLLADGDGGLVLTVLGRSMLADWKASEEGQAWIAEWAELDEPNEEGEAAGRTPLPAPVRPQQLDLFDLEAS